jgi:hypothetical protein
MAVSGSDSVKTCLTLRSKSWLVNGFCKYRSCLLRTGRAHVTAGPQNARLRRHPVDLFAQFAPAHVRHDQVGDHQVDLLLWLWVKISSAFWPLLAVNTVYP